MRKSCRYGICSCINLSLLLALLFQWSGSASAAVTFRNFTGIISATRQGDGTYSLNDGSLVKLADRLIVKAAAGVDKEQLHRIDRSITEVVELYRLGSGGYYGVTLAKGSDLEELLHRFQSSPLVLAVQPDLLQLRDISGQQVKSGTSADYLRTLGIPALWTKTKGQGVKIAIIDDGFALDHEDLRGTTVAFAYDGASRTLDPSPRTAQDRHGTQVAGIVFGRHNGIGIDGIAPEAALIAIRQPDTWTSQTLLSFNLARLAGADIVNCSWTSRLLLEPVAEVIADLATNGRVGKGAVVVFAAGNKGRPVESERTEATVPGVIAVGALDRNGSRLPSSNHGNGVTVYAPGSDIRTTNYGDRQYVRFSGTSAAAAVVSGVTALYLAQNPDATLAEVRRTLATTFTRRESHDGR